jgi:hypothetical protein
MELELSIRVFGQTAAAEGLKDGSQEKWIPA